MWSVRDLDTAHERKPWGSLCGRLGELLGVGTVDAYVEWYLISRPRPRFLVDITQHYSLWGTINQAQSVAVIVYVCEACVCTGDWWVALPPCVWSSLVRELCRVAWACCVWEQLDSHFPTAGVLAGCAQAQYVYMCVRACVCIWGGLVRESDRLDIGQDLN